MCTREIDGLGRASAGSCGIPIGRQRPPARLLSEGNQVRCPLIPTRFVFCFSFKTSSRILLVVTKSSSCFRRSLPFHPVFGSRGACIGGITGWPVCFCGIFGGPEASRRGIVARGSREERWDGLAILLFFGVFLSVTW